MISRFWNTADGLQCDNCSARPRKMWEISGDRVQAEGGTETVVICDECLPKLSKQITAKLNTVTK